MPELARAFFLKQELSLRSVSISLLLCVCALFTSNSFAHKMKAAYTIVLFNERTGYLEVMHRFTLHDAEEAAWFLFDKNADIIAKDETQAQFAQYVVTQFSLKTQPKQPLEHPFEEKVRNH